MSLGISARLSKYPKKHDLVKSHSQSQILANKLRQDGVMSTVENVMQAVDHVAAVLASPSIDPSISYKDSIINLCQHLKVYGAYLDILFQDQLNRAFVVFRNSSQDDVRLDYLSRLHLLELIELRAKDWKGSDHMNQYYRKKVEATESIQSLTESLLAASTPPLLAPGEVIKASGKFKQPTKIPGKNYCKDEVVIRNADSGKVMGIKGRRVHMIEELSETIISFQKVNPGAKERLVQITGATEESIVHAKQLIEDTIRRNASPVREHGVAIGGPLTGSSSSINSSASDESALPHGTSGSSHVSRALLHSLSTNDASLGEYKYTVVTGGHTIKITGDNLDLVRTSKLVLDEYFSGEPIHDIGQFYSFDSLPQPIITNDLPPIPLTTESLPPPTVTALSNGQTETDGSQVAPLRRPHIPIEDIMLGKSEASVHQYTLEYLACLARSPMCRTPPEDWEKMQTEYPNLVRKTPELFDVKGYLAYRCGDKMASVLSADEVDVSEV
ncbi:PREDICTED: eukaryotic translation initiation factor 4E-binding protein Mextli isoform X2 [Nicrophorus vespilloides]|uniref:Eukaryotic translation initiation factor 4E-binding protein Mextli isoform X2 n=1 Tax=Nicrophorus vespilloides TaxID=110193 RepID=A0ABM1NH09_NICVS|nr:PREDICTED: eukaryotic translation initiation factor 4E-binding protein Mextli isoform X2 [Nicrophorus vespilloides]